MTTHGNDDTISGREYLTTKEAAKLMGVSVDTVRGMCKDGVLAGAERSGRGWRIPPDAVDHWLQSPSGAPRPVNHADTPAASAPVMPQPGPPTRWQRFRYNPWVFYSAVVLSTFLVLATAFFGLISAGADFGPFSQQVKAWGLVREFPSERKDETLIIVSEFYRTEGVPDAWVHEEIYDSISTASEVLGPAKLRLEVSSIPIPADDLGFAEKLGRRYGASIVIWGSDTGVRITVNFLNLKQPDFDAARIRIDETERTQIANPKGFASFVTRDLPSQLRFLSLFAIGQSFSNDRAYPDAIYTIESGIATLSPDSLALEGLPEAFFQLGWLYQELDLTEQAIEKYSSAVEIDPEFSIAYYNRASAHEDQGDLIAAIEDYNKAIEIDQQYASAYVGRGRIRSKQGDLDAAIQNYNEALEIDPHDAFAYFFRGFARSDQGDLDTAIQDITKFIELAPQFSFGFASRGRLHSSQGNFDAAIEDFTKAIEIDPQDPAGYERRGSAYSSQGNFDAAIEDFTKAIEIDPQSPTGYVHRGNVRSDQGNLDTAIQDYSKAIEVAPHSSSAYFHRAYARFSQNNLDGAIEDVNAYIRINPQSTLGYRTRGLFHAVQGDQDAAIQDYTKAIEIDPQSVFAYNGRGNAHQNQGDLDAAIQDYTRAIEIDPQDTAAYNNRGVTRKNQGDLTGALTDFHRYLELSPSAPDHQQVEQWIAEIEQQLGTPQSTPGATP